MHSLQNRGPTKQAILAYGWACVRWEGGVRRLLCSGQVLVQVGVVGVTLEVLTRDEVLDALLDLRG